MQGRNRDDGAGTAWHTAHVHHHDPAGIDDLLLDAVAPLFGEIEERLDGAYFTRHWMRGLHVRIEMRCTPEVWSQVQPVLHDRLTGYLAAHPSAGHPDPEREREIHAWLAEIEVERGALGPWCPDNSVQYAPHDERLHVLGTPQAAELLAQFHVATTPLVFGLLDHVRSGGQVSVPALQMMFATATLVCPPVERGYKSYRSHVEGFLANTSDPAGTRSRFEAAYCRNRDTLAALLESTLAACSDEAVSSWPLPDWTRCVDTFGPRARKLHERGLLTLPEIAEPTVDATFGPATATGTPRPVISSFHRDLFSDPEVRRELSTSTSFATYRVMLNYQYLLFSRLGMAPRDRFLNCYLAARTVEDVYRIATAEQFMGDPVPS